MFSWKQTALILSLAAATGCGKKRDGNVSPLTAAQKQEFRQLVSSTSAGTNAALRSKNKTQMRTFAMMANPVAFDPEYGNDEYAPMESAISEGDCQIEQDVMDRNAFRGGQITAQSVDSMKFKFKVSGPNCPMFLELSGGATMTSQTSGTFEVKAIYKAISDEFKKLSDVDAFDVALSGKASGDQSSVDANAGWNGNIHSQAKGNVGINGNLQASQNAEGEKGNASMSFAFPNFTVVLDIASNNGQTNYKLNGEPMTEQQVQEFFADAFSAGEGAATGVGPSEPQPPETPEVPEVPTRGGGRKTKK